MIKPLTSFRFFAALAVFFSHLTILQNFEQTKWIYDNVFYEGYLGVAFFFILSGFILTYNYHEKFQTVTLPQLRKFFKARFARIYPVYVLTFCISLPFVIGELLKDPLNTLLKAITNLLMLQSFIPVKDVYFSFNAPSWSISNEMFFYALFPFLILTFIKLKNKLEKNNLIHLALVIYIVGACTVWFLRDIESAHWLFYIFPVFRLIDFLIGIILALVFVKVKNTKMNNNTFTKLELASILLFIIALVFFPYVHQTLRYWGYYQPFMALIIFIFAFQKGFISTLVSNNKLIYLGEISFSFYMIHQLVIRYLQRIPVINEQPLLFIVIALGISLAASHIIYKYYEIPLKDKFKGINLIKISKFYQKAS